MRILLPSGTPAEVAHPSDGSASMGVVIATDIFGLRPLYDDLVRRLAEEWGMTVCAVEPFPGRGLGPEVEPRMAIMHSLDDDEQLRDLVEAADIVDLDTVGLVGFCMGGMYCHKASTLGRFDRIVSFYGMIRVPDHWRGPGQGEPIDALLRGDAANVLAIVGDRDPWTPLADVDALADSGVTVVRYPEAEHGFAHDPHRPAHRPDDAADAFARAHAWLTSAHT